MKTRTVKQRFQLFVVALLATSGLIYLVWNVTIPEKKSSPFPELARADSLMFIRPDSSLLILEGIENADAFDEGNKALYALLLTQARYRNDVPVENDSLIDQALKYFGNSNDWLHRGWAEYYASQYLKDGGDMDNSITSINHAAESASKSGDARLSHYVYFLWGDLLHGQKPLEMSIEKFRMAEKYASALKDTVNMVWSLNSIGYTYLFMEENDSADWCFKQSVELAHRQDDESLVGSTYSLKAAAYIKQKNYEQALGCVNQALVRSRWMDGDSLKFYTQKGIILEALNQLDSAGYYLRKGYREQSLYSKALYAQEMAMIAEKKGDYRSSSRQHALYGRYCDSIREQENEAQVTVMQKRYEYASVKAERDRLTIKDKQNDKNKLWGGICLLLLCGGAYFFFDSRQRKLRKSMKAKEDMLAHNLMLMQEMNTRNMMEQQKIKQQLASEKKKLTVAKLDNKAMLEKMVSMSVAIKKIKELKEMNERNRNRHMLGTLALNEEEVDSLFDTMDLCYNSFAKKLHAEFSELTRNDLQLCCLIKLGVRNDNIAILLDISQSTLKKRKYRLKCDKLTTIPESQTIEDFLNAYTTPSIAEIDYVQLFMDEAGLTEE